MFYIEKFYIESTCLFNNLPQTRYKLNESFLLVEFTLR